MRCGGFGRAGTRQSRRSQGAVTTDILLREPLLDGSEPACSLSVSILRAWLARIRWEAQAAFIWHLHRNNQESPPPPTPAPPPNPSDPNSKGSFLTRGTVVVQTGQVSRRFSSEWRLGGHGPVHPLTLPFSTCGLCGHHRRGEERVVVSWVLGDYAGNVAGGNEA